MSGKKIVSRQFLPRGIKMPLRALWAVFRSADRGCGKGGDSFSRFAIVATSYSECQALPAQNAKTVSKRTSRACRPGVPKKVPKKSKKSRKSAKERLFRDDFDFFGTLLALRADRPGTTFLRLFWHFGPGGPGTRCNWSATIAIHDGKILYVKSKRVIFSTYLTRSGHQPL